MNFLPGFERRPRMKSREKFCGKLYQGRLYRQNPKKNGVSK